MSRPICVSFIAGATGTWRIDRMSKVIGDLLPTAERLDLVEGFDTPTPTSASWVLRGVTSNTRYTTSTEQDALAARQQPLGRSQATCAALIPMRKIDGWWDLSQNHRRHILEEESRHITVGMEYLPPIARRLYHSRDLGQPFDFLAWLEYAPEHSELFEQLISRLRATREWHFVDREIDLRLSRDESPG